MSASTAYQRLAARMHSWALLVCAMLLVALCAAPHPARAATTLDASGCPAAAQEMPDMLPGISATTTADCTVSFGSDSGFATLHAYQQDGVAPAMPGVSDYAPGVSDWSTGTNAFGACLRLADAGIDTSWLVDDDNTCTAAIGHRWQAVPATQADAASAIGTTDTAATSGSVALRFGVRAGAAQPSGSYTAQLVFEVIEAMPAAPVNDSLPQISGTPAAGATLTASTGTWSNSPDSYAWQWQRCNSSGTSCADISGATSSTYTAGSADVDGTLRVVVTATNLGGSTQATSDASSIIAGIPPTAGTVTISGTTTVGQTLSSSLSGWNNGTPTSTISRQWQRCDAAGDNCTNISGATASTYTLVAADVNATIRLTVTRTNTCTTGCGSDSATSNATAVIAGTPPAAGTVSISGTTTFGQTLTATLSGWTTGTPTGTTAYQWRRCNASGSSCVDISGATGSSYTLVAADIDATIRVAVTRTNTCTTGCGSASATSSATAVIAGVAPTAGTVTVSGTTAVGDTLSSSLSGWTTGTPTSTISRQWQRCNSSGSSCIDISGATGTSYTLVADDAGSTVRLQVTRTNTCTTGCGSASATSSATAVVTTPGPSIGFAAGFEQGTIGMTMPPNQHVYEYSGTMSFNSTVKRTGTYSLEFAPNGTGSSEVGGSAGGTGPVRVTTFALRVATRPSSGFQVIAHGRISGSDGQVGRLKLLSSGTLHLDSKAPGSTTSLGNVTGPTLATNTWHIIELRTDTSASPWQATMRVNGTTYSTSNASGTGIGAANQDYIVLGDQGVTLSSRWYIDDWVISHTASDFPIGPVKIPALVPNRTGTHNTPGNFGYTTNNGSSFTTLTTGDNNQTPGSAQYLSSWPPATGSGASFIRQTAATASDYLHYNLQATSETAAPFAVRITGVHAKSSFSSSNVRVDANVGAATTNVYSTNPAMVAVPYMGIMTTQPDGSPWTAAAVNGLGLRLDSTSTSVNPWTYALMAEIVFPG